MAGTTIYDLNIRLLMQDQATKKVTSFGDSLRKFSQSSSGATSMILGLGTALVGVFGARAGYNSLIKFNADLEQSKTTIAGMLNLTQGGEWNASWEKSVDLVGKLQIRARDSLGTTEEMVQMASMLTRPILAAGLGMADLEDISAKAVGTAAAFGQAADVAARDIEQALMGTFSARDMYARKLLEPLGYLGEEGRRRFNQLTARQRAEQLKLAFANPAIARMMAAQGKTFQGVFSTLQDNLQMTFGKVGLPLFTAITKQIGTWNGWIMDNQRNIARWGKQFSGYLIDGFSAVKGAVSWIIANREMLLTIAKAFLAFKVAQMGLRAGFGVADGLKSVLDFQKALGTATPGLMTFATKLGIATLGLGALYFGMQALADYMSAEVDKRVERRSEIGGVAADANSFFEGKTYGRSREDFLSQMLGNASRRGYTAGGGLDQKKVISDLGLDPRNLAALAHYSPGARALMGGGITMDQARLVQQGRFGAELGGDEATAIHTLSALLIANDARGRRVWEAQLAEQRKITDNTRPMALFIGQLGAGAKKGLDFLFGGDPAKRPQTNITIQHIEVKTDDPDRLSFALTEGLRDAARNPSSAKIRAKFRGLR